MAVLSISNVIQVSAAAQPSTLGPFNTGNVLLVTSETPDPVFTGDYKVYKTPNEVATDFGSNSETYNMAVGVFSQAPNILTPRGSLIIAPYEPSETLSDAILRMDAQIPFFGVTSTEIESVPNSLAAAATVQTLNKIYINVQRDEALLEPGEFFDDLVTGGFRKTRGLFYGAGGVSDSRALRFAAGYLSRLLSVEYAGSLTTLNMNLKDIIGVNPDETMTQTLFTKAQACGADVYASIEGVPKVLSSGANQFADQVSNLGWLIANLQIAGFNYIGGTTTKIPQTEVGVGGLKGAYRNVMNQAVTNGYCAPGEWNSPDTFGNPEDFIANIRQFGFYIYMTPIAEQAQAERQDRIAPLCQIAMKEAGGVNSSSVLVIINP